MPSPSSKPENTSVEVETPIQQAMGVIDRKIRNLEKRKNKLDVYKERKTAGEVLNKDQKVAMEKYESVLQSLDFGRELQKQFAQISNDADKMLKKQQKREKSERQAMEVKRIQELLEVQAILDHMGSDDVRDHFRDGKHGAAQLTDENLDSLDKLYKLISPSRDDCADHASYVEQLTTAAEHIVNFLDSKEKEVIGTATYKDLKELVGRISECGYFDNMPTSAEEKDPEAEVTSEEAATTQEDTMATDTQKTDDSSSTASENQPEKQEKSQSIELSTGNSLESGNSLHQECTPLENGTERVSHIVDSAFFPTDQLTAQKPHNDIVGSLKGSFNFLQDSEVDRESPRQLDPAVVATKPMDTAQSTDASQTQQSYHRMAVFSENQSQQHISQPQNQTTRQPVTQMALTSSLNPSAPVFVSEQNAVSSSCKDFSSTVKQAPPTNTQHSYSTEQSMILSQTTSFFPGSITSTDTSDTSSTSTQQMAPSPHTNTEEKKFTMNADAAVFKSMYSQQACSEQPQVDNGMSQDSLLESTGMNYFGDHSGQGRSGVGCWGRGHGSRNGFSRGGSRGGSYGSSHGSGRGSRAPHGGSQGGSTHSIPGNGFGHPS